MIAEFIRRHHYKESVSVLSQFMPVRDEGTFVERRKLSAQSQIQLQQQQLAAEERMAQMSLAGAQPAEQLEEGAAAACEPGHAPAEGDVSVSGEEDEDDVIAPAQSKNMQRLRKGFRLSSVCWDD